jgi:DNA-binding beta-propeller fold protein YncE
VAIDEDRNLLYVLDSINSDVQQFALSVTASGELAATYRLTIGSYGRAQDQFSYPFGVAVDDANGQVYVSDMGNLRIKVFDADGNYLREFAPPGVKAWQALGLEVAKDGAVYVADAFNNVIWAFEPDGQLRRKIEVKP